MKSPQVIHPLERHRFEARLRSDLHPVDGDRDRRLKVIRNSGNERVIDRLRDGLAPGTSLDLTSPTISINAFGEIRKIVEKTDKC